MASVGAVTIQKIFDLIKRYNERTGATVLTISHDMEFVQRIADEVFMLGESRIVAEGAAEDLFGQGTGTGTTVVRTFADAFKGQRATAAQ